MALLMRAGIETIIRPPWRYAEILFLRRLERRTTISPSEIPGSVISPSSSPLPRSTFIGECVMEWLRVIEKRYSPNRFSNLFCQIKRRKIIALQQKKRCCQSGVQLILTLFCRTLRLRSPRITVLYLQGEGRYRMCARGLRFSLPLVS